MEVVEEIKLDNLPSANFGPGVELLMSGKKKEGVESVNLEDIDKLERELNDLSGVAPSTPSFKLSEPESPSVKFGDFGGVSFDSKPAEVRNISQMPSKPVARFDEVKQLAEPAPRAESWDGFKSVNMGSLGPEKTSASYNELPAPAPDLSPQEMLKEKFKYLRKLEDLESKGVNLTKKYSMESPLMEMQGEYENIVAEKERSNSVKFQGKMLMACITGVEFLNNKFDPFDLKLDGWAEQVGENLDDYDDIFAELHEKYKSKAKMAPELKLMFQLGGSAIMLHMTNSMFKSAIPGMDDIMRQNPELMQRFTQAAVNSMSSTNPGFSGFMNTVQQHRPAAPEPPRYDPPPRAQQSSRFTERPSTTRPEMKGPSDINDILSGLKTKPISAPPAPSAVEVSIEDPGSTVSLSELQEMKDGLKTPAKSKRRPRSDKNTITLDF
jgi:hypothetical protein